VGSKSGFTSLQKNTMSMGELLLQLIIRSVGPHFPPCLLHRSADAAMRFITRATIECADSQRNLVASLNGLAGVALVNGDKLQAVRNYRQVLSMEFRPIDDEGRKQLPSDVNEGSPPPSHARSMRRQHPIVSCCVRSLLTCCACIQPRS
jgi:hypothetical protein